MARWSKIGIGAAVLVGGGLAIGYGAYRSAMARAESSYHRLLTPGEPPTRRFALEMVAGLPEVAQRYFTHAIAPGALLYTGVELEMDGTFLLGDKGAVQSYAMSARQVVRPPDQFVWLPRLRSGPAIITGSDALVEGDAWSEFWLAGLLRVAHARPSGDLARSAQFRGAVEAALWMPTTLLPDNGVRWEQVGPNEARITLTRFSPEIVLTLTLSENGAVRDVVGQRWSNANRERRFQLQPFGGTVRAEATFQQLTIPAEIAVGNHYGTEDYLPFFQARITAARYF